MIKLINILNEIGEGTANSYPYNLKSNISANAIYTFTTESSIAYRVTLNKINNSVEIDFLVESGEELYPETNKGELFKVMSTIVKITLDYINDNPDIEYIRYDPKAKDVSNSSKNQRDALYRKYIEKYIPNVTFFERGGSIFAKIK